MMRVIGGENIPDPPLAKKIIELSSSRDELMDPILEKICTFFSVETVYIDMQEEEDTGKIYLMLDEIPTGVAITEELLDSLYSDFGIDGLAIRYQRKPKLQAI